MAPTGDRQIEGGESPSASALSRRIPEPAVFFLACLAAACALLWPCIGLDRCVYGRDTMTHDYGLLLWAWQAVRSSGRFPLWNPYLFGGIPTLGSFAVCPFTPPAVLFAVWPFSLAFTFQYLLAFAIGGTGMALLARRLGVGFVPALAAGLVFALSGHFTTLAYAGHLTKALAFAWAPWLFWAGERWFEGLRWRGAVILSLPLTLMLTASHFQIAWLAVFFQALWLVGRWIAGREWRRPRRMALAALQFAFAIALAAALGAAQVLPGLEMAPISNRAEGVSFGEASQTSYPPEELLEYAVPGFFGSNAPGGLFYVGRWGAPTPERIVSDYFGLAALALALLGLVRSRRKSKWIWAAIAAGGAWIGAGSFTPLFSWLRAALPGFASFRSPAVAMGWTTVGGVVLAAFGLECALTPQPDLARRNALRIGFWALAAAALAAASAIVRAQAPDAQSFFAEGGSGRFALEQILRGMRMAESAGALRILALFSVLMAIGAWRLPASGPVRSHRALAFAWIVLLAFDVGTASRRYIEPVRADAFTQATEGATPEPVRADTRQPVRIVQEGSELSNAFLAERVGSIHGYHPIVYERYQRAIRATGFVSDETSVLFHQNWLLARPGEPLPAIFAPLETWQPPVARGVPGASSWVLCRRFPPAPYPILPPSIVAVDNEDEAFAEFTRPGFAPEQTAVFEWPTSRRDFVSPSAASVRALRYEPDEIELRVDLPGERAAVFGDLMAPGWTLWRLGDNGRLAQRIDSHYADVAFRGAILPAGSYRCLWRYRPFSFRLGAFLSLLVLGVLTAFAIGRPKGRRSRAGS